MLLGITFMIFEFVGGRWITDNRHHYETVKVENETDEEMKRAIAHKLGIGRDQIKVLSIKKLRDT